MKNFALLLIVFLVAGFPPAAFAAKTEPAFSLDKLNGISAIYFSDDAKAKLSRNGFVITEGFENEMYDAYDNCKEHNQPVFVTTDSVLHTSHIFFDRLLRVLEIERLYPSLDELVDRIIENSVDQYEQAKNEDVKELARLNIGFFAVTKKILDPAYKVPFDLENLVNLEIQNIESHEGIKFRNLLTYVKDPDPQRTPYAYEDFSQYIPRGHYTRNETFQKYFKAMMWLGRVDFKLVPGEDEAAKNCGEKMTLQAILLGDAIMGDAKANKLWKSIYETTSYFVGESDDLSIDEYIKLIKEIFPSGSVDKYADASNLEYLISKAMKLSPPKILSNAAYVEQGDLAEINKGFRFMGQRFIPDSYIFQELVYGKKLMNYTGKGKPFTMEDIPNAGPVRAFPRGLDLMAVLGSKRALAILEAGGDTDYKFYYEQLDKLRGEFSSLKEADWQQNLYFRWLYSLLPLLEEKGKGNFPKFMKTNAWLDKELQTSLGSWTGLRHDTILYAKQSYTEMLGMGAPVTPAMTYGYVEPYPEVYGRVGEMIEDMRAKLSSLGIEIKAVREKIDEFEDLLAQLKIISEKQLKGWKISQYEYGIIWNIGEELESLQSFPADLMEKISSPSVDNRMDIVADVHTDVNTRQVLEEGIGSPSNIYVIVEDSVGRRLCQGAVFSYYEFKHPMDDRLTDEKWQSKDFERPAQPDWLSGITSR